MTRYAFVLIAAATVGICLLPTTVGGQQPPRTVFAADGIPPVALPDVPAVFNTAEGQRIRVGVVTKGLSHPWGFAFLPDGNLLVTERSGSLRLIRDGVLDAAPIAGLPDVFTGVNLAGLMDIALHPRFSDNRFVYLTYSKPTEGGATVALARGRLDGHALSEVRDIFVADADGRGIAASRLLFAPDGTLYMTVGGAISATRDGQSAQNPSSHVGKVLRLRDDGSVPDDNPFVGRQGHHPEIFSMGHRNQLGLAFHPETGALWASENAPMGGDEVNIIAPGRNYGWPVVSYSREYFGPGSLKDRGRRTWNSPRSCGFPPSRHLGCCFTPATAFPCGREASSSAR